MRKKQPEINLEIVHEMMAVQDGLFLPGLNQAALEAYVLG